MPLTISVTVSENNRHLQDVTTLLFKDEKLYSAAEDGIVKVWDPHLRFLMELRAHESVVFHLATIGDTLYTCSNDGTIKAWDIDTLEHKKTLLQYDSEVWRLFAAQGRLYAGDVQGTVRVYENDELLRIYDLTEEVRDMAVSTQLLYTVRDRDLVITELLPGPKGRAVTRQTIEGSSPMCLVGDMICFVSRSARDILVHDNTKQSSFKELGQIQAHEMIINTLCPEGNSIVYSGGYDTKVKKWDVSNMKLLDSCDIGRSISALSIGSRGQVYVAGSSGYIARLDSISMTSLAKAVSTLSEYAGLTRANIEHLVAAINRRMLRYLEPLHKKYLYHSHVKNLLARALKSQCFHIHKNLKMVPMERRNMLDL